MSSVTLANHPIVAAFVESEKVLGANRIWCAANEAQQEFLEEHFAVCRDEVIGLSEIESTADTTVGSVNEFLVDHGFPDVQLDDQGEGVYAASVMKALLKWVQPGTPCKLIAADGKLYDYFALDTDDQGNSAIINLVEIDQKKFFHIEIETADDPDAGTCVNLLVDIPGSTDKLSDLPPATIQAVLEQLLRSHRILALLGQDDIARMKVRYYRQYNFVVLPMLDLEQKRDVDWLLGMSTVSEGGACFSVVQAIQMNRLKMNEFGVKAESAFGMAALECMRSELAVTTPFIMWLTRPSSLQRPLFVAYVDYDAWKNPGSLE